MILPEVREKLLSLYDSPHPSRPGVRLRGYDRDHAHRTTTIAMKVAGYLGFPQSLLGDFEVACLLHDLGRVGLDKEAFGCIFSLARSHGVATRPRELRQQFPHISHGEETDAFIQIMAPYLAAEGIEVTDLIRDQIEMRLGFKDRLGRMVREHTGLLASWGVALKQWMTQIMLYYYYPEELKDASEDVLGLARILVASEQFDACNNRERGRDYYAREKETLRGTFEHMETLVGQGLITAREVKALAYLTCQGQLDRVLLEARELPPQGPLPQEDLAFVLTLRASLEGNAHLP